MPKSKPRNAFYAQSGGVTAVINASACGVIETARKHKDRIGKVFAGRNGAHGNHVEVQHGKRYVTRYSHLESIRVSAGDWVDQGAVVGTAGATGHVTGVHLHFEVWKDGHPADPLDVLPDPDGPRTLVHQTAW